MFIFNSRARNLKFRRARINNAGNGRERGHQREEKRWEKKRVACELYLPKQVEVSLT